ncbi:MAG: hypothetical protein F6K42_19490, partial [Leptolyngbya sp. SIO1D8]|nr:hypothetical protein [Leptolyngbya sp. SIO1D8]
MPNAFIIAIGHFHNFRHIGPIRHYNHIALLRNYCRLKAFSKFYAACPILGADEDATKASRLALAQATLK